MGEIKITDELNGNPAVRSVNPNLDRVRKFLESHNIPTKRENASEVFTETNKWTVGKKHVQASVAFIDRPERDSVCVLVQGNKGYSTEMLLELLHLVNEYDNYSNPYKLRIDEEFNTLEVSRLFRNSELSDLDLEALFAEVLQLTVTVEALINKVLKGHSVLSALGNDD